jgi:Fis family transcriptional regulator
VLDSANRAPIFRKYFILEGVNGSMNDLLRTNDTITQSVIYEQTQAHQQTQDVSVRCTRIAENIKTESTKATDATLTLRDHVSIAMRNYFSHLDGQPASNIYEMVFNEVEAPLLERILEYTGNNQTKAADLLGLNRGTLRKKLKKYGL